MVLESVQTCLIMVCNIQLFVALFYESSYQGTAHITSANNAYAVFKECIQGSLPEPASSLGLNHFLHLHVFHLFLILHIFQLLLLLSFRLPLHIYLFCVLFALLVVLGEATRS